MPLKEKNKLRKHLLRSLTVFVIAFAACGGPGDKGSEESTPVNDSISRARQKAHNDSLKKKNPLLILPPDSTYTGDYIDKYPNGIIKFKGQYRFGQKHGEWLSFYPNGLKWSEMHFDKGLKHGPNSTYYETGTMRYSGFFKNDKQDSTWTYWDSIGKIAAKVLYKNDRIVKKLPVE